MEVSSQQDDPCSQRTGPHALKQQHQPIATRHGKHGQRAELSFAPTSCEHRMSSPSARTSSRTSTSSCRPRHSRPPVSAPTST